MLQFSQERGVIGFEGLHVSCIIGTHGDERTSPQALLIDLRVGLDFPSRKGMDTLSTTLDYRELSEMITQEASQGQYHLLETLASRSLDKILDLPPVQWAWIRLRKPKALQGATYAFVELERHRSASRP